MNTTEDPPPDDERGRAVHGSVTIDDLRRRTPYDHPDVPIVACWSEKAGCTSLFKWYLSHSGELAEATAYSDWIHDWELAVMLQRPGYADRAAARLNDGVSVVKLVRDPFARAVSGYLMMFILDDASGHFTVPMRRQVRELVYGDPDVPYSYSFLDHLRWLDTFAVDGALPIDASTGLDEHLAPQRLPFEERLGDLRLVRLERFDDDIASLEHDLGLPTVDLDGVTTSHHHTVRSTDVDLDPESVVRLHIPIPTLGDDYPLPPTNRFATTETVAAVARLFRADYDAYGYEPPVTATGD